VASVKILVVEDESIVARDIADMLKEQGYDVPAIALSGEQALQKTGQIQPDLVLMDIVLKGDVDGIEAAEQIRRRFDIPVIYLTAYTDEQTVKRAKITEPFGYITKPFDKRELCTNIEMALYKHKTEKALRRERDKAQKYLDVAGVMLVAIDTEQRVGLINKKGCDILGYKEEEIIAKNWFDNFLPERIRSQVKAVFEKAIRAEADASEYRENPILTKSGNERLIAWHDTVLRDEKGKVIATLSSGEDITERKRAEETLRESEEKYRDLFENAGEGIITLDTDGRITGANKLVEEYGFNGAELLGKRLFDFVPEYEKARSVSDFQSLVAGSRVRGQMDVITPKGIIAVEYRDTPIVRAGEVIGVQAILTDITEHKKAEDVISKLAKFPDEDPYPVLRISGHGTVVYANKASLPLLKVWRCRVGQSLPESWHVPALDALSSGQSQQIEVECNDRMFSLTFAPIADTNYVNVYGLDITEHKKAEDRLLEYQGKLKAMASERLMAGERERRHLAVALHDEVCQKLVLTKLALESSLNLVSDANVLASLRIACEGIGETIEQADSLTFELSNPVLRQLGLVIALEKYLTEKIRQKYGIEYELEGDEQLNTLPDEIKNCLFRVTRELLTNVVKHAQAHKIKVSVRKSQSQIYVRVQDDGVGFKESQAGSTVSKTARFGLFSIREQLEYLGGHLEIESEPGRGTTATVVVPLIKKTIV